MRRLARMVTVLVVLAMAAGSVINVAHATSMAMHMAAAAHSDAAMPGCDGCPGGNDAGMACAAGCITPVAAVMPSGPSIAEPTVEALIASGAQPLVDHRRPPDPYPPRTTVLG